MKGPSINKAARKQLDQNPTTVFLWKLQRRKEDGTIETHPTAGGNRSTWSGTESMAKATAGAYPGWTLVLA